MSTLTVLLVLVIAVLALAALARFLYALVRQRGQRVVTCPETQRPASVRVHSLRAALSSLRGRPKLQLNECSRWPEREGCGQECLADVQAASDGCMVHARLVRWYAGKQCALCGVDVDSVHWYSHQPGLLSPQGRTLEWSAIPVLDLEGILETHRPICWNCHVIEDVIQEHPERVVFRP